MPEWWSPKGDRFLFGVTKGSSLAVDLFLKDKKATQVASRGGAITPGPAFQRNYDVTPDGRILGVVAGGTQSTGSTTPQIEGVLNWFEELRAKVPTKEHRAQAKRDRSRSQIEQGHTHRAGRAPKPVVVGRQFHDLAVRPEELDRGEMQRVKRADRYRKRFECTRKGLRMQLDEGETPEE